MILFIAGIDTEIGKTVATGLLGTWFQDQGLRVATQKLVQTGCDGPCKDIQEHRRLMRIERPDDELDQLTCPANYPFPASPHLAAELAGQSIDVTTITDAANRLSALFDIVLLEGTGGLCVPLTREKLTVDLIARQSWPVVLVTAPRLGSINHTLLSLEAMHRRNIELAAILYNLHYSAAPEIESDTREIFRTTIAQLGCAAPIIDVPGNLNPDAPPRLNNKELTHLLKYAT